MVRASSKRVWTMTLLNDSILLSSHLRHTIYFIAAYGSSRDLHAGFSHMKMQKLLYYVQGIIVAAYRRPLFPEPIYAWEYGPVVADAWYGMRHHGANDLPIDEIGLHPAYVESHFSDHQSSWMRWILAQYAHLTAQDLVRQTHDEPPWIEARRRGGVGAQISLVSLKNYFRRFL